MELYNKYITYIRDVRRYSPRTVELYSTVVRDFITWASQEDTAVSDSELVSFLIPSMIRQYEVSLFDANEPKSAKTINLHLSALSGFCRFLIKSRVLKSNPVKLVPKPKVEKRLPHFFKKASLTLYFEKSEWLLDPTSFNAFAEAPDTVSGKEYYSDLLSRVIISVLYSLGIRRSELLTLRIRDVDFGRKVVKVHGKGDKMREIPLISSLSEEILLYLKAVEMMCGRERSSTENLFVTSKGNPLYPMLVDRTVKRELGDVEGITGRKSPHVLRHSLATDLMNDDVHLNSIKEFLGHSSLSSTQVYTHTNISRLKKIYEHAHPRAKNGGKHGD